jgi:hypothetical protein
MEFDDFRKRNVIKCILDPRRFRILKLGEVPRFSEGIISIVREKNEVTVIASEDAPIRAPTEEKYFRLITFDLILPFDLTGFLSFITSILARSKVPVFVVSSFSTDHLLIREEFLAEALKAFKDNGILQS